MKLQSRRDRMLENVERGQAVREVYSTPAYTRFLSRDDLTKICFPSGNIYIFLSTTGAYGSGYTLAEAVQSAISNELREVSK